MILHLVLASLSRVLRAGLSAFWKLEQYRGSDNAFNVLTFFVTGSRAEKASQASRCSLVMDAGQVGRDLCESTNAHSSPCR